jgi:hypothetical protein
MPTLPNNPSKQRMVRAINENAPLAGASLGQSGSVIYQPHQPRIWQELFPCQNNSGQNLPAFSIVGLDSPLINASDNLQAFQRYPGFNIVIPDASKHFGKWGILRRGIAKDKRGWVQITGFAVAKILINDTTHLCAGLHDGDPTRISSFTLGVAQIKAFSKDKDNQDWCYFTFGNTVNWNPGCSTGSGS